MLTPLKLTPVQQEQAYAILDALHKIDAFQGWPNRAGQSTVMKWVDQAYAVERMRVMVGERSILKADLEEHVGRMFLSDLDGPPTTLT